MAGGESKQSPRAPQVSEAKGTSSSPLTEQELILVTPHTKILLPSLCCRRQSTTTFSSLCQPAWGSGKQAVSWLQAGSQQSMLPIMLTLMHRTPTATDETPLLDRREREAGISGTKVKITASLLTYEYFCWLLLVLGFH